MSLVVARKASRKDAKKVRHVDARERSLNPKELWTAHTELAKAIVDDTYDTLDFGFEPDSVLEPDDYLANGLSIGHIWRGRYTGGFADCDAELRDGDEVTLHPHSTILVVDDRQGDVRNLLAEELIRVSKIYANLAKLVKGGAR